MKFTFHDSVEKNYFQIDKFFQINVFFFFSQRGFIKINNVLDHSVKNYSNIPRFVQYSKAKDVTNDTLSRNQNRSTWKNKFNFLALIAKLLPRVNTKH